MKISCKQRKSTETTEKQRKSSANNGTKNAFFSIFDNYLLLNSKKLIDRFLVKWGILSWF